MNLLHDRLVNDIYPQHLRQTDWQPTSHARPVDWCNHRNRGHLGAQAAQSSPELATARRVSCKKTLAPRDLFFHNHCGLSETLRDINLSAKIRRLNSVSLMRGVPFFGITNRENFDNILTRSPWRHLALTLTQIM